MPVFELVAPLIMANSTVLKLRQGAMSMDDFPSRANQMQRNAMPRRKEQTKATFTTATSKSVARTCEFLTFTETSKYASFGRNWIDHYTGGGSDRPKGSKNG
nr:hypothetical protein [Brucella neotomae]